MIAITLLNKSTFTKTSSKRARGEVSFECNV